MTLVGDIPHRLKWGENERQDDMEIHRSQRWQGPRRPFWKRFSLTEGRLSAQLMAESPATWAPLILHQTLALQTHTTRAQKEANFLAPILTRLKV